MTKDNEELYSALQMQMDDLKDTVHRIEEKTDQICTLATKVEVVQTNLDHLRLSQNDCEKRCDNIQKQVTELHDAPYDDFRKSKQQIISNVLGNIFGKLGSGIVGALIALIASGKIHF